MSREIVSFDVTTGDNIGLEDYGYPRTDMMGKGPTGVGWIRVVHGWFFWDDENPDLCATYLETWVNEYGDITMMLSDPTIYFDFVTPLDDYTMPGYTTYTIGDYVKKYNVKTRENLVNRANAYLGKGGLYILIHWFWSIEVHLHIGSFDKALVVSPYGVRFE